MQTPLPTALDHAAIVALADGQTGLLCGGLIGPGSTQSACYFYNSTSNGWTNAPSLKVARYAHGMAMYKGKVYVYGGMDNIGTVLNSVEVYGTSRWALMPFTM